MGDLTLANVADNPRTHTVGRNGEDWVTVTLEPDGDGDFDVNVRWGGELTFEDVIYLLHNTAHDMAEALEDEEED